MSLFLPLQLHISIQVVSDLLQTLCEAFMAGVTQLHAPQLTPGHFSIPVSMPANTLIHEAARERGHKQNQIQNAESVENEKG